MEWRDSEGVDTVHGVMWRTRDRDEKKSVTAFSTRRQIELKIIFFFNTSAVAVGRLAWAESPYS